MFRRRPPHPVLEPFLHMAAALDDAQRALLAAIPTARDDGIPLAEAIVAFERGLAETEARMPAWRTPATAAMHDECAAAIRAARVECETLRLEPETLSFEALNARIGDVLHPLEVFADTERALRRGGS
ncbi:MAG TPA: hypothetical protein VM841_04635 [Actinomycetota bacterium]|nr:hypothetical protein [Actinomycetota bacterium]